MQTAFPVWFASLPELALLLVWLVAAILAVKTWYRHRRVSRLVLGDVAILLFRWMAHSLLGLSGTASLSLDGGYGGDQLALAVFWYSLIDILLQVTAWVMVLAAVFVER